MVWASKPVQSKHIYKKPPPSNCLDLGSCQRLFCSSVFAFIWNFLRVSSDFAIKAEEAASGRSDSTVSTVQLIPQKWIILATSWYFGIRRDKRHKQKQAMYFSGALTQFTVIACAAKASCSEFNNQVWVLKAIYSDALKNAAFQAKVVLYLEHEIKCSKGHWPLLFLELSLSQRFLLGFSLFSAAERKDVRVFTLMIVPFQLLWISFGTLWTFRNRRLQGGFSLIKMKQL